MPDALPPVPDIDGRRFCRACGKTLPVEDFEPGKRRYLCRFHHYERVKKPCKERMLADPRRKLAWKLWKRAWVDAKTVFNQPRVALTQGDIEKLVPELCQEKSSAPTISLLPMDPAQLVSPTNFVLVDMDVRRAMLQAYRSGGVQKFMEQHGKHWEFSARSRESRHGI